MNRTPVDIVHTTISPCENERRIFNEAITAQKQGWNVIILALKTPENKKFSLESGIKIHRISIRFWQGGALKFLCFNGKLFWRLMFIKFQVVHAHDLWVLPGSSLAALIKRKKLVYDAHEFPTGLEIFKEKRIAGKIWQGTERILIGAVSRMITINSYHSELFRASYPALAEPIILMNYPVFQSRLGKLSLLRRENKVIFQGILKYGRGLPQMVQSMNLVDHGILEIIGYGDLEKNLRDLVLQAHLERKVFFRGKMSWDKMLYETQKARAGLVLFEPKSENYAFASPNKFFEYVMSGTPVIASDIATFQDFNRQFEVAILVNPDFPEQIAAAIGKMLGDDTRWEKMHKNCLEARKYWNWEVQEMKLVEVYRNLLLHHTANSAVE